MSNKGLSPKCRDILINRYIGKENYLKAHKETRKILIIDAMNQFKIDLIQRHGSLWNYVKD